MEEIDSACQDAVNGIPSKRPVIEMTIPLVLDSTISPPSQYVINLFIPYTPYKPTDGSWEDGAYRDSFAQPCFSYVDEYAPGFSSSIIGYDMLTPPDLESIIGLTGGNIFHGAMGLDSLFLMRPAKGWSNYKTHVRGLYLCRSGAHPGGGVMGAPGHNAAHIVIQDLKKLEYIPAMIATLRWHLLPTVRQQFSGKVDHFPRSDFGLPWMINSFASFM